MKVCFSVLHYKNYEVTKKCINSLLNLIVPPQIQVHIVIVCNPSGNDSNELLVRKFENYRNIKIIENDKNLGFTGGNNVGFKYIKKISGEIAIIMNNDMEIEDRNFLFYLEEIYSKADIIAPNVKNLEGVSQNPFRIKKLSKFQLIKEFIKVLILNTVYRVTFIAKIYLKLNKLKQTESIIQNDRELYNIVPHGSIIIYTKRYIQNENFAFVPGPFLYGEEDLLMWYLDKNKYSTYYANKLKILHLEHISTGTIDKNVIKNYKKIFTYKLKSLYIILKKEFF